MKRYPSLGYFYNAVIGEYCYAFRKLDGSNIRAEWSKKRGWYKFGTRNTMIDENTPLWGEAVTIFNDKYADNLEEIFLNRKNKIFRGCKGVVVFMEFLGENSFAGSHLDSDKKDLILFDVNPIGKGFLLPKEFIKLFEYVHTPEIMYHGVFNKELIKDVYEGLYDGGEGLVCKSNKWSVKLKTKDWLDKIKGLDSSMIDDMDLKSATKLEKYLYPNKFR